jgi:hypothetical protein
VKAASVRERRGSASVRERRGSNKLPIDQKVAHRHCRERNALPLATLPRRQKKP